MGFFKNMLKGATSLNPKKSAKHFVGSIVDPAGTTLREGRGKDSLPTNAKGYYDPAGALTPKVIRAKPTSASPMQQYDLPPIGSHATLAPPLPGMSSPKALPSIQNSAAFSAQAAPGTTRAFKTAQAPSYTTATLPAGGARLAPAPVVYAPGGNAKAVK